MPGFNVRGGVEGACYNSNVVSVWFYCVPGLTRTVYLRTVSLSWDTLSGHAKQNRDRFVGDAGGSTCCLVRCVLLSIDSIRRSEWMGNAVIAPMWD